LDKSQAAELVIIVTSAGTISWAPVRYHQVSAQYDVLDSAGDPGFS